MANPVKKIARRLGVHVERLPADGTPGWNQDVSLNFPVELRSRWGFGQPHNPQIYRLLIEQRANYERAILHITAAHDILKQIPHDAIQSEPGSPFWNNTWFTGLDAASLVGFLCGYRPKCYMEIGSGFSTRFCRKAIIGAGLDTKVVSIDPNPRAEIDDLCDQIIRQPLERCDLAIFDKLQPGDILFFDGSHRVLPNSDATVFFLEVLPRLKPGVILHIHDVFLPDDYPPAWSKRVYSEQYILAALLLFSNAKVRVLLPCYFISVADEFKQALHACLQSRDETLDIPLAYPTEAGQPACSFWFEMSQ